MPSSDITATCRAQGSAKISRDAANVILHVRVHMHRPANASRSHRFMYLPKRSHSRITFHTNNFRVDLLITHFNQFVCWLECVLWFNERSMSQIYYFHAVNNEYGLFGELITEQQK